MVDPDDVDLPRSRIPKRTQPTEPLQMDQLHQNNFEKMERARNDCACDQPDLALDENVIGPARVQVLWCDRCETILTTIAEVYDGDD